MKKSLHLCLLATAVNLSACSLGSTETTALYRTAIEDAKHAPRQIKLAYLRCYSYAETVKEECHRVIRQAHDPLNKAMSWEYIRPFEAEAERQGFMTFLQEQHKTCTSVADIAKSTSVKSVYQVECTPTNRYTLTYNEKSGSWQVKE